MKKMMITNPDGTKMNVDLVRYFKFCNNCYLIYTIGEFDEKNYQKLYLMKVLEELGVPVIQNIKDETEWKGMQKIVKKVIKELKTKKMVETKDLDYSLIDGIKVSNPRFFKLDQKLVDILSSNYFENELSDSNDETIESPIAYQPQEPIDDINNVVPNVDITPLESQEKTSTDIIPEVMPIENKEVNPVELESLIVAQPQEPIDDLNNVVPNVDVTPLESQEKTLTNIIPEVIPIENKEINPVELESPIAYQPQEPIDDINNVVPNVDITPLESQEKISTDIIPEVMSIEDKKINPVELESPIVAQPQEPIDDLNNQIEIKKENNSIDYKELYLTLKKENDSINETMETLLNELIKYKEKYGELD